MLAYRSSWYHTSARDQFLEPFRKFFEFSLRHRREDYFCGDGSVATPESSASSASANSVVGTPTNGLVLMKRVGVARICAISPSRVSALIRFITLSLSMSFVN